MLELSLSNDYTPSDGEIDNLVYLTCKYTAGWPMRQADKQVCVMMAGEIQGAEGITKLVKTTCEYVWDHICGEPDDASPDKFFDHMKPLIETW